MKKYKNINYRQRPRSYWAHKDVLSALLRNVKGRERRELIKTYWEQGRLHELDEGLLGESLSDLRRRHLGRLHPFFMGGEYLPDYKPGEGEIARIELRSSTRDVISIRARPVEGEIGYRVVDEHKRRYRLTCETSPEPLDLEELVNLIDEGDVEGRPAELSLVEGLALLWNEYNLDGTSGGNTRKEVRYFTSISSEFYPKLHAHYEHVFDDWVAEQEEERARERAEKEEEERWARLCAEEEEEGRAQLQAEQERDGVCPDEQKDTKA